MILKQLADYAKERVEKAKRQITPDEIKTRALSMPTGDKRFLNALKGSGLSLICEVKKASPSKGIISPDFPYLDIAKSYEKAGADCISCLTEPKWFMGSDEIFREIRNSVSIPMIRKDFTVDEYQIYEAKCMGADCVLLICALLDTDAIKKYIGICDSLGLSALVETHNEDEIRSAVQAGAEMIGVNNRNLKDFTVDISNSTALRGLIPKNAVFVAESGITSPKDAQTLRRAGADALLIGEALMRSADRAGFIAECRK